MQYQPTNSPVEDAARALADAIIPQLQADRRVLWLASGGSGVAVGLILDRLLKDYDLSNLTVALTDERYGPIGHADENWQQLLDNGLSLPGASTYRILQGMNRQETALAFSLWLSQQIETADFIIGLFGIGTDGHTAGLKPRSSALESKQLAADFEGDDFERITITPRMIEFIHHAVIQASGGEKDKVLRSLLRHAVSDHSAQPAQLLRKIPTVTLVTDRKDL